jgi:dTDP-4-amino-4,6-dideoxygalactose transaminase
LGGTYFRNDLAKFERFIARAWPSNEREVISCLSVRSGWDLLLGAFGFPAGAEVLMSAVTIPDMAGIVEAHGLVPVPLELDCTLAAPTPETLRQAITSQSKIVVIAHLFGSRVDLNPHIEIAHEHSLLFVEDCAQAYVGTHFSGHARADVSMFSFGTIKTSTALGGGVLHLRDAELCRRLKDRQAQYPVQSRSAYFRRLLKYSGLKLLSTYPVFALFTRCCKLMGINQNALLNRSARGFAGSLGVERFRLQPSVALLALMARRMEGQDVGRLERQRLLGNGLLEQIRSVAECPGSAAAEHSFWVFPVLTDRPRELIDTLHQQGFDATQGDSLHIVKSPEHSPRPGPLSAQGLLNRLVYVPIYPEMTDRAVDRLAVALLRFYEGADSAGERV